MVIRPFEITPQRPRQPIRVDLMVCVTRKHYAIHGVTGLQIIRGLLCSPLREKGRLKAAALTRWRFTWTPKFTNGVSAVSINVEISVTYPRWLPKPLSSRILLLRWYRYQLLREWRRYLGVTRAHENHHVQISLDAAQEMKKQIEALPSRSSDSDTAFAVPGVCHALIREVNERNTRYDLDTRHGINEGARFRPIF